MEAPTDPLKLWDEFRGRFFEYLEKMDPARRRKFWSSTVERTKGYKEFLPEIAGKDYIPDHEYLHIDVTFFKLLEGGRVGVPIVIIEYENECKKSDHEVAKLLSTAAPLRVLITWAQWSKDQFGGETWKEECIKNWTRVIRQFAGTFQSYGTPLGGVLGILVGECGPKDRVLRFYYSRCDLGDVQLNNLLSDWREVPFTAAG